MTKRHTPSLQLKYLIYLVISIITIALGSAITDYFTRETKSHQPTSLPTPKPEDHPNVAFVTDVIDGDTIKVIYQENPATIRLIGIDAPEKATYDKPAECMSLESTNSLSELVLNKYVILESDSSETDKYGRLLRYIYFQTPQGLTMINQEQVSQGLAEAKAYPPDTKYQQLLESSEDSAKQEKIGIWQPKCQLNK